MCSMMLRFLGCAAAVWPQLACDGVGHYLGVGKTLDDICLDYLATDGRMLPVVVEGVEEGVQPSPAFEVTRVLATMQQVADLPIPALDADLIVLADLPRTVKSTVSRVDHDSVIVWVIRVATADRAHPLLEMSSEELIEVLPAIWWHLCFAVAILGRVLEGLDGLVCDGSTGVHSVADLFREVDCPLA